MRSVCRIAGEDRDGNFVRAAGGRKLCEGDDWLNNGKTRSRRRLASSLNRIAVLRGPLARGDGAYRSGQEEEREVHYQR